jgi:hypothetical protein
LDGVVGKHAAIGSDERALLCDATTTRSVEASLVALRDVRHRADIATAAQVWGEVEDGSQETKFLTLDRFSVCVDVQECSHKYVACFAFVESETIITYTGAYVKL